MLVASPHLKRRYLRPTKRGWYARECAYSSSRDLQVSNLPPQAKDRDEQISINCIMTEQGLQGLQDQSFILVTGANRYVRFVCLLRLDGSPRLPLTTS